MTPASAGIGMCDTAPELTQRIAARKIACNKLDKRVEPPHRLSDPLHRIEALKRTRDWFTRHLHTEPA